MTRALAKLTPVVLSLACVDTHLLPNEHHCAQQSGDQWCAEQHPDGARPFCLRGFCEAEGEPDPRPLDGCVIARPPDDTCYSPCGHGSSLPDDATCLEPENTDASTTEPSPTTSGPGPQPICGDAIVDLDEACDDGEHNGEPSHCALDCHGPTEWCGDGLPQQDETCDDGNAVEGDGCNPDCRASGAVVWERELILGGCLLDVDIASDGAVYVAGTITSAPAGAWAARLDDDGTVDWPHTVPSPAEGLLGNSFFAVRAFDEDLLAFVGRSSDHAYLLLLDDTGSIVEEVTDPFSTYLGDVVDVGNGYLVKRGETAVHYDYALSEDWTATVGAGLAYRPGDLVALAAPSSGASFRRFTLDGTAFEPATFWLPMGFFANSQLVAWTHRGDVVVAGQISGWDAEDAFVVQSSPGGDLRWLYGIETLNQQHRHPLCLAVDRDDAIIIGGYASLLSAEHHALTKLSPTGELLWTRSLEFGASTGRIYGCTANAANEIIAVGEADGQMWLAKVTP